MSRRPRPHYRPDLGWNLGVAFADTLTRSDRLAQGFTFVRCCGSPRASSPHGLAAPGLASHDGRSLRAVASGSRLLPTRPAKDFHLQSSAHARHTCAWLRVAPRLPSPLLRARARAEPGRGGKAGLPVELESNGLDRGVWTPPDLRLSMAGGHGTSSVCFPRLTVADDRVEDR
jgi:hypothetical protein